MPALFIQYMTFLADFAILLFVGYYFLKLNSKERELEKRENKIDSEYHQVVDNALAKERKIMDDATSEAEHIITGAEYVNKSSKEVVDQALQKMVDQIHTETVETARNFMNSFSASLGQISQQSQRDFQDVAKELEQGLQTQVTDFQNSAKELEVDLQKQIKDFHDTLLPGLEKELDDYKKIRMKQADQTIASIVQKASQEILNKTISLDDHQKLIIESLEKAKKEGIFD